ncbi:MAG: SCO family protein [Bacteroidetes bacterium]|nr:SCO family protein [Bacteroidota bacterium]
MGKHVLFRWVIVAVVVMIAMFYGYKILISQPVIDDSLPVYGERNADSSDHVIGDFKLIDQDGSIVTQDSFYNKVYVADFFFTTCQGICPKMSNQMQRVFEKYKGDRRVMFLSHTVKPSEDSVPVLKEYALRHGADSKQWHFVTGDKKEIYELARKSYLVSVTEGTGGPDDFVHTQFFALIDTDKRIRGFYDGTDSTEVNKLMKDILNLIAD